MNLNRIGIIFAGCSTCALLLVFLVSKMTRPKDLWPPFKTSVSERGTTKIKDYGANPCYSAWSEIGGMKRDTTLPDLLHVDYTPVELHSSMDIKTIESKFIALSLQRQIICTKWEIYGRKDDGGWPVCLAEPLLAKKPCTVYSFGIRYDFSFDDAYRDNQGCTIRSFDPSMTKMTDHEHSPNVHFYLEGLSDKKTVEKGWKVDTLRGFLKRFKEENVIIPYLKFDVDVMEWKVLKKMFEERVLDNVVQVAFELHTTPHFKPKLREYFSILKKLEELGFRRWWYRHRLNGFPFQCDQAYINLKFLKGTRYELID